VNDWDIAVLNHFMHGLYQSSNVAVIK
jgi:hypothetical protein